MKITNLEQRPVAERILERLIKSDSSIEVELKRYENGREHGYVLTEPVSERAITFSEYRNSDDIVLYFGDFEAAIESGEGAAESIYNLRAMLPWDGEKHAERIILCYLANGLKPTAKELKSIRASK